jgi:hypothetical protein
LVARFGVSALPLGPLIAVAFHGLELFAKTLGFRASFDFCRPGFGERLLGVPLCIFLTGSFGVQTAFESARAHQVINGRFAALEPHAFRVGDFFRTALERGTFATNLADGLFGLFCSARLIRSSDLRLVSTGSFDGPQGLELISAAHSLKLTQSAIAGDFGAVCQWYPTFDYRARRPDPPLAEVHGES